MLESSQPIGIFDSGVGGLTIAKAVTHSLPKENIIYFGDTTHLPYGEKSTAAIQAYCIKIVDMLLQHHCKLILIACNSASAAAFELVKEYVNGQAHVLNAIDPVISYLGRVYPGKQVGLIGTRQTVNSNIFFKKIKHLNLPIRLCALATPILAAAIEEGFANKRIVEELLKEYLSHPTLNNIDALLLACTHYPVIKDQIADYYRNAVQIIDTTLIIAKSVEQCLKLYKLENTSSSCTRTFYVSDYTTSFYEATRVFFGESVHLEHFPLWAE
jgi:glutamate racemase